MSIHTEDISHLHNKDVNRSDQRHNVRPDQRHNVRPGSIHSLYGSFQEPFSQLGQSSKDVSQNKHSVDIHDKEGDMNSPHTKGLSDQTRTDQQERGESCDNTFSNHPL